MEIGWGREKIIRRSHFYIAWNRIVVFTRIYHDTPGNTKLFHASLKTGQVRLCYRWRGFNFVSGQALVFLEYQINFIALGGTVEVKLGVWSFYCLQPPDNIFNYKPLQTMQPLPLPTHKSLRIVINKTYRITILVINFMTIFVLTMGRGLLEWLAAMCSHIPNRGEQMVRYYGY